MLRRNFLLTAAATACHTLVSRPLFAALTRVEGTDILRNQDCPIPYENNIRDRLWMWGHDSGSLGNYISKENSQAIKAAALRQAAKYKNFVGLDMDDFFRGRLDASANGESDLIVPAALTPGQVIDVQKELNTTAPRCRGKKLDLSIVWYTHQIHAAIKRHIDQVDVVYFWTWNANHLVDLEKNFKAFRDICPDVRVRMGVYMWNFNNKAVVPTDLMKHQLDCAYRWLRSGEVEGLIFHCTPLCDMDLKAVEHSRRWIDDHGEETVELR